MIFDIYNFIFRAKSRNQNEWIYGHLAKTDKTYYIAPKECPEAITVAPGTALIKYIEIDTFSLGAYSFEQDIDGNNVYSGDVLETIVSEDSPFLESFPVLVMFDRYGFVGSGVIDISPDEFAYCRIIGNIIDNRELMDLFPDTEDEEE